MSDDVPLNLSISDPAKFESALESARAHGLTVTRKLEGLGIASGSIARSKVSSLRAIDGIDTVEEDRTVSVPKPVR